MKNLIRSLFQKLAGCSRCKEQFDHCMTRVGHWDKLLTSLSPYEASIEAKEKLRFMLNNSNVQKIFDIFVSQYGYMKSVIGGRPVAANGHPLPWYTYPAIEYFNRIDVHRMNIFEYSSGYSSLYWADKGANVYSVEHDSAWYEQMCQINSPLAVLELCEDRESYSQAINNYAIDFDIIIIDGVWRNDCLRVALKKATPETLFIIDNSDWYTDVVSTLLSHGYFQVDWNGFGPINPYTWTTSLFLPFKHVLGQRISAPVPIGGVKTQSDPEMW